MFEFLFGRKPAARKTETMRQTAERAVEEINAVLANLPDMPAVTLRAGGKGLDIEWPEQMPDEAKALPAPTAEELADTAEADAKAA